MESKAYPGEFFFFVRVTELLQGLGSRFSINLGYIDALAPYAERGLRMSSHYDMGPTSVVAPLVPPSINPSLETAIRGVMVELKKEGKLAGGQGRVCGVGHGRRRMLLRYSLGLEEEASQGVAGHAVEAGGDEDEVRKSPYSTVLKHC